MACSAWTAKANKRVQFGYGLNYLIDIENAVIVDVEATPARTYDEVAATKTMITRTEGRLGLKAKRLVADTAYGTGKFLSWLIGTGITPHIPVWDKSIREDGTFSRADFTFDNERNVYVSSCGQACSRPQAASAPTMSCATSRSSATARSAPSSRSVVRRRLHARSHAISMRPPASVPVR